MHPKSFGREYLTRIRICAAIALMLVTCALWHYGIQFSIWRWHFLILPRHGRSEAFLWYISLFIGLAIWHRITCVRDISGRFFDRGVYWRCFSLFGWLSDHITYCWVEPFVSLSLASWLPQPLKGWLIVASIAMFLKYHIEEIEHMLSEKKYVITRTGVDEVHDIASQSRRNEVESTHYASTGTSQASSSQVSSSQMSYPDEQMAYENLDQTYHDMMNKEETT